MQKFIAEAIFGRRDVNMASTVTTSKDRVIIANKSIWMLEGIINTQPTSDVVLGRVSAREASPISTFERPYGPSSQVNIGLASRADTGPSTPSTVGFVYIFGGTVT